MRNINMNRMLSDILVKKELFSFIWYSVIFLIQGSIFVAFLFVFVCVYTFVIIRVYMYVCIDMYIQKSSHIISVQLHKLSKLDTSM